MNNPHLLHANSSSSSSINPNINNNPFQIHTQFMNQHQDSSNMMPHMFSPILKKEHDQGTFGGFMMPSWVGSDQENPFSVQPNYDTLSLPEHSNPSMGPPYPSTPSLNMSATALLQKAAQMGHVYADPAKSSPAPPTFSLSLSAASSAPPTTNMLPPSMPKVGDQELTRDFLGLRPLSQSEIFNIAALGDIGHHEHQKSWQG